MKEIKAQYVGKIRINLEKSDGSECVGVLITPEEWEALGLHPDDWALFTEYTDDSFKIEKTDPCKHCKEGELPFQLQ